MFIAHEWDLVWIYSLRLVIIFSNLSLKIISNISGIINKFGIKNKGDRRLSLNSIAMCIVVNVE